MVLSQLRMGARQAKNAPLILLLIIIIITVDIIIITVIFVIECNATGQRGICMRRFARGNVRVCRSLPIFC